MTTTEQHESSLLERRMEWLCIGVDALMGGVVALTVLYLDQIGEVKLDDERRQQTIAFLQELMVHTIEADEKAHAAHQAANGS